MIANHRVYGLYEMLTGDGWLVPCYYKEREKKLEEIMNILIENSFWSLASDHNKQAMSDLKRSLRQLTEEGEFNAESSSRYLKDIGPEWFGKHGLLVDHLFEDLIQKLSEVIEHIEVLQNQSVSEMKQTAQKEAVCLSRAEKHLMDSSQDIEELHQALEEFYKAKATVK